MKTWSGWSPVEIEHVPLPDSDKKLILLYAGPQRGPFTFYGRPYQRIETTSSVMPRERYQQLLLERMHTRQRWENQTATGVRVEDLNQEEILRTVRTAVSTGRLPDVTVSSPEVVLERFGLRRDGELLNAAVVLFGTKFLPDYP